MNMSVASSAGSLGDFFPPWPIVIAASSDEARARAVITAETAGYRSVAVSVPEAVDRLDIQVGASAVWLELDHDHGQPLDQLLDRVNGEAAADRFPAIICSPLSLIDRIMARVTSSTVELLVSPSQLERAGALALTLATKPPSNRLHDISGEPGTARLRQLSDEVSRIAATLARLSTGPSPTSAEKPAPATGEIPSVSLDAVRQVIRARRLRARFFDETLFADPAWDMLLDLLQAEIAQHRVPVSSLCIAASVPATTALRWIRTMTDAGLFQRRADPHDGRRVFIELSPAASEAMRRYFAEVGRVAIV